MILVCFVLIGSLVVPASAESTATKMESFVNINAEGDCLVSQTVTLHLEASYESLTFPLPVDATNITMNGSSVRTTKTASAIEVDVGRATNGLVGDFTVRFDYTIPDAVKVIPFVNNEGDTVGYLQLEMALLNGFSFPVEQISFVITLPGDLKWQPSFTSTYRQSSIESGMNYTVNGNMITGSTTVPLQDHESVFMTLVVPNEMFPTIST